MHRRDFDNSVITDDGMVAVAVYGSLRKGLGLHRQVADCPFLGRGILHGADLYSFGAYPAIALRDDASRTVVVEVYAVDVRTLQTLDGIEGAYDRDVVTIMLDNGKPQPALVYTMTDDRIHGYGWGPDGKAPHVEHGDWTEYKRQLDRERNRNGLGLDGWGPDDIQDESALCA
jgi:gamma-glutamylcyclotransferase (GGCT)/AIG2-like uncharacterized protein YtfP